MAHFFIVANDETLLGAIGNRLLHRGHTCSVANIPYDATSMFDKEVAPITLALIDIRYGSPAQRVAHEIGRLHHEGDTSGLVILRHILQKETKPPILLMIDKIPVTTDDTKKSEVADNPQKRHAVTDGELMAEIKGLPIIDKSNSAQYNPTTHDGLNALIDEMIAVAEGRTAFSVAQPKPPESSGGAPVPRWRKYLT